MARFVYNSPPIPAPDEDGQVFEATGLGTAAWTRILDKLESIGVDTLVLHPSEIVNITAVGGITPTHSTMVIKGDGGPVTVTAVPQIAAGAHGQILIIKTTSSTDTVTLHDGDGLHLHSGSVLIMGDHDTIMFTYDTTHSEWVELASNFKSFDTGWSWASPTGSSGTFYVGGFYILPATAYVPTGGTTLGTANVAYGAHAFIVLGANSTDMVVRVTGTSIGEDGSNTPGDTQDLDTSGGVTNDYFETTKKWVGQISISLLSGTGVTINHGLCKYWDNQNSSFRMTGLEVTGRAGANDTGVNFEVLRHEPIGWTYSAGGAIPPPALADMQTDYNTEFQISTGEPFAWKRVGLSEEIAGNVDEGILWRVTTTANKAVEIANFTLSIRPS